MTHQTMLLILCAEQEVQALVQLLDDHPEVSGFTELQNLQGSGSSGRHLGTRAYPGTVSMIFTVGSEDAMNTLAADLRDFAERCRRGQGLRVFAMPATQVV